ncbi:MAG: hypothetical protein DRN95_08765 [Candidatus Hydrothermarchaeota archaeon]|nr:MAG: hypothetical protein DRN95_08765 [Candidatus Hydrothermarchaeota archaeon]
MTDLMKLFAGGFSTGILFGISVKAGFDISPEGISFLVGAKTCQALQQISPECSSYLRMVELRSGFATLSSLAAIVAGIVKGSVSVIVSSFGFIVGFTLVMQ